MGEISSFVAKKGPLSLSSVLPTDFEALSALPRLAPIILLPTKASSPVATRWMQGANRPSLSGKAPSLACGTRAQTSLQQRERAKPRTHLLVSGAFASQFPRQGVVVHPGVLAAG
ncbi:uncharacterized protein PgNI_07909 [Pyricularia grisea]|uniref:Uncharacterized protein n=1 Tax=Pyricularia grisea TaxID=148305 RepID=A0A6P8B169_PYRGI|nr:uncharacterized protein PgNI_07909 [Pyricularia grisea]TLD08579.1 hypothetical protein PgNI_07909 [Pyricularia grisea]